MTSTRDYLHQLFNLEGKVAIVTGGTGVLGGAMARGLARAGATVAIMGRRAEKAKEVAAEIIADGGQAIDLVADVMQKEELIAARQKLMDKYGRIDILLNAAGGNDPKGSVSVGGSFFELTQQGMQEIIDLNLMGTLLPCQVFGEVMANQKKGYIINISSLSVPRALTRVVAYSAGKAAIENFTRWLAIEMARAYGPDMHVNAIAPGFFLADQNRRFMIAEDGQYTPRAQAVLAQTPAKRFGEPDELIGAAIWLCSPAASFVNGIVVEIDGGFGSFSGV